MRVALRPGCSCIRKATCRLLFGLAVAAGGAWSQNTSASLPALPGRFSICESGANAPVPGQLTFQQQVCWYANDLISPSLFVRAGFASALGEWHNDSYGNHQDGPGYAHRFGVYFARRSARDAAELIAGYWNHEDPRPHTSGETGTQQRLKAALMSVLIAKTENDSRPALSPIAGALASALTGATLSREHDFGGAFARKAACSYAGSFATAVYKEFRPDLSSLVRHALHKHTN